MDNFQNNSIGYCDYCGAEIKANMKFCGKCGSTIQKSKRSNSKLIVICFVIAVLIAAIVFSVLIFTHTICIKHEWIDATCTEAKHCKYCDKTDGKASGHKKTTEITEEPTLVKEGEEQIVCSECGKVFETKTIDKKEIGISGKSFNFYDDEFIEWFEDEFSLNVGDKLDSDSEKNTMYSLNFNGEIGILSLVHEDDEQNSKVCSVMVCFDDVTISAAIISLLGEAFDSDFSRYDCGYKLLRGGIYSNAGLTTGLITKNNVKIAILVPDSFIDDNEEL